MVKQLVVNRNKLRENALGIKPKVVDALTTELSGPFLLMPLFRQLH